MANNAKPASMLRGESDREQTTNDSPSYTRISRIPPRQTAEFSSHVAPGQTTSKRFLNLRRASLVSLLVAPLVAIPPAIRVLVDRTAPVLADVATTNLERLFAWRTVHSQPQKPDALLREPASQRTDDASSNASSDASSNADSNADVVAHRAPHPNTSRHRGIVVRADAVLRAVHSGGRPSSVPAPASDQRPAGLSLAGVSRFGTGLHDGDILTSVGGTSATSEGSVIGTVAAAIGQGAKVVTGVVWRGDQRIDVAVEIPSPETFAKPRRRKSVHK